MSGNGSRTAIIQPMKARRPTAVPGQKTPAPSTASAAAPTSTTPGKAASRCATGSDRTAARLMSDSAWRAISESKSRRLSIARHALLSREGHSDGPADMSYGLYIGKNLTGDGIAYLAGYGDEPSSHWLEI